MRAACTGHCSNYQFKCDDGCCIDISYACDGKQHCPDRSDEDFCTDCRTNNKPFLWNGLPSSDCLLWLFLVDSGRKSATHRVDPPTSRSSASPIEAEDASMLPAGNRKGITPAGDRSRARPPQDSIFKETAVGQGQLLLRLWNLIAALRQMESVQSCSHSGLHKHTSSQHPLRAGTKLLCPHTHTHTHTPSNPSLLFYWAFKSSECFSGVMALFLQGEYEGYETLKLVYVVNTCRHFKNSALSAGFWTHIIKGGNYTFTKDSSSNPGVGNL